MIRFLQSFKNKKIDKWKRRVKLNEKHVKFMERHVVRDQNVRVKTINLESVV